MSENSSIETAGSSGIKLMTRKQLFDKMQERRDLKINEKLEYLENFLLSQHNYSDEECRVLRHKIAMFKVQFKRKWVSVSYKEDIFKTKYSNWLQGTVEIPVAKTRQMRTSGRGRPTKSFTDLSKRTKRHRTEDLRQKTSIEELAFATQSKLRTSGLVDASAVLQDIVRSPEKAATYRKICLSSQKEGRRLTSLKALSMFVDAQLTRDQYEIIRTVDKKLYPCYSLIQKAKKECYPIPDSYSVTETTAEINLQNLLDHTATRLILYLEDVINNLAENECTNLELISKWGCDGSQQAQYKQKFANSSDTDTHIFQSSFVPIRLCSANKIIWQNPTPSSPRYCRPIRIRFIKESVNVANQEVAHIQKKINELKETEIQRNRRISIKHTMLFTMIDGKICNAVTETLSTLKCYICGSTSKEFNDLSKKREVNSETLQFGLSILHSRIRIFENLLHLSYKLPIKKWQLRSKADKDIVQQRKKTIQQEFKTKMGIIIDMPKPGFGNTNDGNTSRRFFSDYKQTSIITGIDEELIYRFKIILEVISSGHKINIQKFTAYATHTAEKYVALYSWYPMSPTVHKILIHGPLVIANAILPIGQLSEEAAEARNKHFRSYRLHFARKCSREACNMDIINRLLLTSDPLLSSIRVNRRSKSMPFSKEALDLLLPMESASNESETESEEEISSE